jgi:hypothetical protein
MTATSLEARIVALEREMREVKSALRTVSETEQPWWERLAGMFKDEQLFGEVVAEGQKYRRSLAPRAR